MDPEALFLHGEKVKRDLSQIVDCPQNNSSNQSCNAQNLNTSFKDEDEQNTNKTKTNKYSEHFQPCEIEENHIHGDNDKKSTQKPSNSTLFGKQWIYEPISFFRETWINSNEETRKKSCDEGNLDQSHKAIFSQAESLQKKSIDSKYPMIASFIKTVCSPGFKLGNSVSIL